MRRKCKLCGKVRKVFGSLNGVEFCRQCWKGLLVG